MPKQVFVKINSAGLDTGPFNVTNDAGETLATGVTKIALFNGITYTMADAAAVVYLTSTGTCTNVTSKTIVQIFPTPTPTPTPTATPVPTPTSTPTPTPTGTPTPVVPILTLGWANSPKMFTANLSQALGFDITIQSIYADGYTGGTCTSAVASASELRNINALPAGNTNYSWTPQVTCGGIGGNTCWNGVTKYTIYNVKVNGNVVSDGDIITISGVQVKVSFEPCRITF